MLSLRLVILNMTLAASQQSFSKTSMERGRSCPTSGGLTSVRRHESRHLTLVVSVVACGIGLSAWADDAGPEVWITGRLVALERQPHCGVFTVGSAATYKVVAGPMELMDKEIKALVYCIEIPRGNSAATYGDLET